MTATIIFLVWGVLFAIAGFWFAAKERKERREK